MSVSLYHVVRSRENFETAAKALLDLVRAAIDRSPDEPRHLFLDIDGHRNSEGGFDHDMFELQQNFLIGWLMPFLSEATFPLGNVGNPKPLRNDLPEVLEITGED